MDECKNPEHLNCRQRYQSSHMGTTSDQEKCKALIEKCGINFGANHHTAAPPHKTIQSQQKPQHRKHDAKLSQDPAENSILWVFVTIGATFIVGAIGFGALAYMHDSNRSKPYRRKPKKEDRHFDERSRWFSRPKREFVYSDHVKEIPAFQGLASFSHMVKPLPPYDFTKNRKK